MQKEDLIYSNYLCKEKILEIIKICEENSIFYSLYTLDIVIAKSLQYDVSYYSYEYRLDNEMNIEVVEDIYSFVQNYEKDDFLKITICDSDQIIFSRIMCKLKEIGGIDVLDVGHMSTKTIKSGAEEIEIAYFYTEITNENVNKWTALEHLINLLGISKEETMGIGDNVNDRELVQNSGMGVAMGHSCPALKEVADDIVMDNNSSGVAEALNIYINNT